MGHPAAPPATPAPEPGHRPKVLERPHPLTGVAKSWIALVAVALVVGRDVANNGWESFREFGPFAWLIAAFVLLFVGINLARGIIEWRTTTFVVDDDEFRIERSFLSHRSSRISYAKIQSVDIQRALAARMLGLASVHIDVGGAGGQRLEFLSRARAEALRDELLDKMRALSGTATASEDAPSPENAPSPEDATESEFGPPAGDDRDGSAPGPPERMPDPGPDFTAPEPVWDPPALPLAPVAAGPELIVRMAPQTLLLGLFVSGFLPWLVGAIAVVTVSITVTGASSLAALGGIVIGVAGYLWTQVTNHWNFVLTRTDKGLHLSRGMFTTVSRSLKPDRIQAVSIHQDYLQRLTGLFRVRVTVLGVGSVEEAGARADVVLPYGTRDQVEAVLASFWPGLDLAAIELHGQPDRARWLTPFGFRRHQWGVGEQALLARHGWLNHTISLVPHRRVQSIGLTQGPLQRLVNLAAIQVHTTDGPVRVVLYHLDPAVARQVLDEQMARARFAREDPSGAAYLAGPPTSAHAPATLSA